MRGMGPLGFGRIPCPKELPNSGSGKPLQRHWSKSFTSKVINVPNAASHKRMRLFQDRVEHRREVAGRGIDDLQHLGRRGLLLQSLARLGQEPRVLHRDDRLRREILQQRDLLLGKRPDLLAIDRDRAEQPAVLAKRHIRMRANTAEIDQAPGESGRSVGSSSATIGDVDKPLAANDEPPVYPASAGTDGCRRQYSAKLGSPRAAPRDGTFAVDRSTAAERGIAKRNCLFQHRVEHRREVAGRRIDDLQDLGGRGLLLQRLARLGDRRAFSIAITACAAKFCSSAICLSENGRTSCGRR